jgi:DUF1365 family protein
MLTIRAISAIGFNSISLYYCYAADGRTLEAVVGEVTSTPWGERHPLCAAHERQPGHDRRSPFRFPKAMHVSPFLPMDMEYHWHLNLPGERLTVHMDDRRGAENILDATLVLAAGRSTAAAWPGSSGATRP